MYLEFVIIFTAFISTIVYSMSLQACIIWQAQQDDDLSQCEGGTWRLQTISEMVARSDTAAELFSLAGAITLLVTVYILACIVMNIWKFATVRRKAKSNLVLLLASVLLGSLGYVGLTVINLRVEKMGLIHTLFTAQCFAAMFIQLFALKQMIQHEPSLKLKYMNSALFLSLTFGALYVIFHATADRTYTHDYSIYFAFSKNIHAMFQILFIAWYYVILCYVRASTSHLDNVDEKDVNHVVVPESPVFSLLRIPTLKDTC